MARTNATNFSGPLQFPYATAGTDIFKKEDVQTLAQAVDGHDHSTGKGLTVSVAGIPSGAINGSQIADATITSAKITDGTIQSVDIAAAGIANDRLGPDVARANLLTNPGLEIWQRGNGPFTGNAVPGADKWLFVTAGTPTCSWSRNTASVDGVASKACAAVTVTGATSDSNAIYFVQVIEDFTQLRGRPVTLSVRVAASAAGQTAKITWVDGVTGGGAWQFGPALNIGTAYATYSLTITPATTASQLYLGISFESSATFYVDNAMLVVGSQAANYVPLHPADDLARCKRHFEIVGGDQANDLYFTANATGGAQGLGFPVIYSVEKPVVPTVTRFGSFSMTNASQPSIVGGKRGGSLQATSTAAGLVVAANSAGVGFSVEANT